MRQALVPLLLCCAFAAQAEEKTLNIYSWSAYLPEQALQRFKDETGIKVKYDIFDSAEALDSKLLTGGSGYDVVFPASSGLARAIQAKAVQPLDRTQLPHLGNLDDELLAKLASADPGNQYGLPYTWGTVGVGFNRQALEQRLPGVPLNSLDLLFKPEYASKLKDCGIAVIDSPQEVISIALNYLGKAPTAASAPTSMRWRSYLPSCSRTCAMSAAVGISMTWPGGDLSGTDLQRRCLYGGGQRAGNPAAVRRAVPHTT